MQQTELPKAITQHQPLLDKRVKDLIPPDKRRLVEVPYTASLSHTMNVLVANHVVAVPVAAPPGHWIGAGGSMILEYDKQTRAARKHYIGMVTMLDILAHIAGDDATEGGDGGGAGSNLEQKMAVPVSSVIGHCLEGLSLWTLNPSTKILDCMEVLSKGIHRVMVPVDSNMANVSGVELMESASSYRMITQMDVLRFLREHFSELEGIISKSVRELKAVNENVLAITDGTRVIEAIKCMKNAMLTAVPVVQAMDTSEGDPSCLVSGEGRKLVDTFSATDLRGCHLSSLEAWLPLSVLEFTENVLTSPLYPGTDTESSSPSSSKRELVTCLLESPIAEVIEKAVTKHVHRVWVVDGQGLLLGLISLTDVLRALRNELLPQYNSVMMFYNS